MDRAGPCPVCEGKDRFRFDDRDGTGSYYCQRCGPGLGIGLVMAYRKWDFAKAALEIDNFLGSKPHLARPMITPVKQRTPEEIRGSLRRFMAGAAKIAPGAPSWNYLERRCGDLAGVHDDLWHHPSAFYDSEQGAFPALLAVVRDASGTPVTLHRTFLDEHGNKANVPAVRKLMAGIGNWAGGAVRLGPLQARMGVAEGIETAICAGKLHGITVWSALNAHGVEAWVPPEGVQSVVICGDCDSHFAGQISAYKLAQRLEANGVGVEIRIPSVIGKDWCDIWTQMQRGGG